MLKITKPRQEYLKGVAGGKALVLKEVCSPTSPKLKPNTLEGELVGTLTLNQNYTTQNLRTKNPDLSRKQKDLQPWKAAALAEVSDGRPEP